MKFVSHLRFDILQLISHCKSSLKCASTQAVELVSPNQKLLYPRKEKKMKLHAPVLNSEKLQELNNICGVIIAINHVSWAKISISSLTVLNWNGYSLPSDFVNMKNELKISLLASTLKQKIPSSDIYVMENQKKFSSSLNDIYLRAMLVLLLSFDKDVQVEDKVIVQKTSVLNNAHKLLVGGERKSARPIVKNMLGLTNTQNEFHHNNHENPNWYSDLEISENQKNFFVNFTIEKQESLSLALLLTLSFLNKNYFENLENSK